MGRDRRQAQGTRPGAWQGPPSTRCRPLAFLSAIDAETFEIAFAAVTPAAGHQPWDDETVSVCRACGTLVGIFPDHGLDWQHYRGDGITSGAQQIYDPGHAPDVTWCLPDENPQEF